MNLLSFIPGPHSAATVVKTKTQSPIVTAVNDKVAQFGAGECSLDDMWEHIDKLIGLDDPTDRQMIEA